MYADGLPSAVADQLELDRLPWAMLTQRGEKVFDRVERPPGEPDEDVAGRDVSPFGRSSSRHSVDEHAG